MTPPKTINRKMRYRDAKKIKQGDFIIVNNDKFKVIRVDIFWDNKIVKVITDKGDIFYNNEISGVENNLTKYIKTLN